MRVSGGERMCEGSSGPGLSTLQADVGTGVSVKGDLVKFRLKTL